MISGSQAVTIGCDRDPSSHRGAQCSCAQLCDGGWRTLALPVTFWSETVRALLALLFSVDDTDNIGTACLRAWYLIYTTETLWPFCFRETVKVTVRIFHKEKSLFRGEAAYHNVMKIPWAGDRNLSSLLKQAALAADFDFLSEPLGIYFLLLKLHQQLDDGLKYQLIILENWESRFPWKCYSHKHQLEYFYLLSVSVILQSISDVDCTQGLGFLLIIFYCRIIHFPHSG